MMDYRVVYDATRISPDFWFAGVGCLFALAGGVLVYGLRRETTPRTKPTYKRWFPYFFVAFGLFGTTLFTAVTLGNWVVANRAMREGRASVIEGVVSNFEAMPPGGHARETFTVGDHAYGFGGSEMSGQHSTPVVHGGRVREGQHVRIHDYHGAILKLEIAASEIPTPTVGMLNPAVLIVCAGVFVLGVWFPLTIFAMSWTSGWRGLARRFRGARLEDADGYLMQSGRLGYFGRYRNALNVRVGEASFSMVPMFPADFFHEVLVIPWEAVQSVTGHRRFFRNVTVVKLAGDGRELEFDAGVGDALRESSDIGVGDALREAFERWRGRAR